MQPEKKKSYGLMIGLAMGHALKHFYQQAFLLLIPSFKEAMLLTDVQVGLFGTARTVLSAGMNIPAGIMADMWRSKVGLILFCSLMSLAIGYLIIGATSSYWLVLLGVAVTGLGTSLWHAPAFGTLGAMYPEKRATALAIHRMGGSVGDSISPIVMGVMLGGFVLWGIEWGGLGWRTVALMLVAPAVLSAFAVLVFYGRQIGEEGERQPQDIYTYLKSARGLLTNGTVVSMVVLTSVRAMAHNGLNIFLIVYMDEDLGYEVFKIGYHMALLTLFGVVSAPIMGWLSDKIGRRPVISVALGAIAIIISGMLIFEGGLPFTILLALLGLFLYTVNPVMLAAAIDAAPKGTESSVTALMFTGPSIFGAMSPVIAGFMRDSWGMDAVFIYASSIVAVVAVLSLVVPMKRVET
ncbi:MAG: MFS transporter [Dehalococcoidia bacterium]|nr:MFS transporter [Dehalococcoidia bacterium]MQG00580.1 MFS transporter [SAR202 cluster bacterium]|tara:strand:- start:1187 stop:2410 length:1224 start_codon:yes stop_codon:yes gene_type:complete